MALVVRGALFLGWLFLMLAVLGAGAAAAGAPSWRWQFESEADLSGWRATAGGLDWAPGQGVGGSGAAELTLDRYGAGRAHRRLKLAPGSYRLAGTVSFAGPVEWARLGILAREALGAPPLLESSPRPLYASGRTTRTVVVPCEAAHTELEVVAGRLASAVAGGAVALDEVTLELEEVRLCPTDTPRPPAPTDRPPTATPPRPPSASATPRPPREPGGSATAEPAATPSPGSVLVNGGFESAENGEPIGWRTYGGVLARVERPVHSGRYAGGFTSSTTVTKWVYQMVAVEPGGWYELSAHVFADDPQVEGALLRVSWYLSDDGSGRAAATVDSTTVLETPEGRYRRITTGPVRAPAGVRSAKLRILLRPRSAAGAIVYIDDASFEVVAPAPGGEGGGAGASGGGGGGTSSDVRGAFGRPGEASGLAFPMPVLMRDGGALDLADASPAASEGVSWWPWALAGVAGAGLTGWGAWRWQVARARARADGAG